MIKAMSITDWLRLFFALTGAGLSLYYGSELTKHVANLLGMSSPLSFQYKVLRWMVLLVSASFLGIALPKKSFIETLIIFVIIISVQVLRDFISS